MKRSLFPVLSVALLACASPPPEPGPLPVDRLGDLVYRGTQSGEVQLVAGVWQGEPYDPDGEERPEVDLAGMDPVLGDLDGDGSDEALVVLTEQTGGSGIFVYLAVVAWDGSELTNVATSLLGDRVAISSLEIVEGQLVANIVTAGPGDTACCPTHKQEVRWRLAGNELRETAREDRGRIERD